MKDLTKRFAIRSKAIRNAARNEPCTVCGRNDGTTVFCHINESWAGKGMGQKADDLGAGFFGCSDCHDQYDHRAYKAAINVGDVMRAVYRTTRRLWEKGIISIKEDK